MTNDEIVNKTLRLVDDITVHTLRTADDDTLRELLMELGGDLPRVASVAQELAETLKDMDDKASM